MKRKTVTQTCDLCGRTGRQIVPDQRWPTDWGVYRPRGVSVLLCDGCTRGTMPGSEELLPETMRRLADRGVIPG